MKKRLLLAALLMFMALTLAAHAQAAALTPSLTVNGGASASVAFNEAPTFRICAPGATAVRLLAHRLYQDDNPKDWDCYFDRYEVAPILEEGGMKMFDQGTWRVTADYTTDDYDDDVDLAESEDIHWTSIGSVTVQVADWIARLNPPSATLSAGSVNRGGTVTVTVSAFQHKNEWYWMDLERKTGEDDWEFMEHIDLSLSEAGNVNTCVMPTAALEPGDYRLWVRTEAVRYEDNGTYLPFTVKAGTAPALSFQLSQTRAVTSENIALFLYAPGADRMEVDIAKDGEPYWRDGRSCGGDTASWGWSCSDRGTYIFTPRVWKGGQVIEGSPVTLTVVAPDGDLDTPKLSGVPGVMTVGTAIEGSFSAVPHAEAYHIELDYAPQDGEWERVARFIRGADDTALSLPGALFARPGMYSLEIHANAGGWNGGHLEHWILVTEPMDETLTLTVNGSADDIEGWLSQKSYHVEVQYPESITALKIMNGDHWEFFDVQDFHGAWWGRDSGDYTLIAMGTEDEPVWRDDGFDWGDFDQDELNWTAISNSVRLNVVAPNGRLEAPALTVPAKVTRGDWLRVIIGEVAKARDYFLWVYRMDDEGREYGWAFNSEYPQAGEVLIPTIDMQPGETLYVQAESIADGYERGRSEAKRFTVSEGQGGERFLVSATEVLTREPVTWSVVAPGAERVRVTCDAELYSEAWGDALTDRQDFEWPGDYVLKALAPDGEGWRVIGEPVTLHVTAPNGSLPAELEAPASISSSGTATFTVRWKHNGVRSLYETNLCNRDWEDQPLETVSITSGAKEDIGVYRVRGADLTPGEVYTIESWLRPEAPGYSQTRVCAELAVTQGTQKGTVTVSHNEVLRCEPVDVTVDVPGATALWVYHGEGRWDGFVGSHAEARWDFFQIGDNQVYARYTTQTIGDPENVDFESLNWTGVTPIETVRVNTVGQLSTPDYTLESEIVKRGQPFRITIDALQGHDEWYIAGLQDMDHRDLMDSCFWDESTHTLKVDTAIVEPDLYYLHLHGDAVGYESCDVWRLVAVEEPEEGLVVSLPETVVTVTRPLVTAFAPGAQKITLTLTDPSGVHSTREYEQQGEVFREEARFGHTEGPWQAVFTAHYAGGRTETVEREVQVIAPYGNLPNPTLRMDGPWIEGQDLRFMMDAGDAMFIYVNILDRYTQEYVYEDRDENFGDWHYVIPADSFEPGHPCNIEVYSVKEGCNANSTIFWVVPLPENPKTFTLPGFLTEIEAEAFEGVAAEKIVIPGTVTSIEASAFANCPDLLVVEIEDGASGISTDAFVDSGAFMIYGHEGSSAEAYATANPWATFISLD